MAKIPNHGSKPTYLLRESYHEDGKVKTRTVGNITSLGVDKIARISQILKGQTSFPLRWRLKYSVHVLTVTWTRSFALSAARSGTTHFPRTLSSTQSCSCDDRSTYHCPTFQTWDDSRMEQYDAYRRVEY
ncbi:MAG: hypothetical protein LBG58_08715 [Planctomycetaceae bacterium]|nr:hypothetical protein [Planctomycetaceae bacterium]